MNQEVLVVIGAGGIGQAIARRQGPGRSLLLADSSENTLESAADALRDAGHRVTTRVVDVTLSEFSDERVRWQGFVSKDDGSTWIRDEEIILNRRK